MKVWRVAHSKARYQDFPSGPYISSGLTSAALDAIDPMRWDHGDTRHPAPDYDPLLGFIYNEERCGFDSEKSLYDWFEGFVEMLDSLGFKVWVYEVSEERVRVGEFGQALFHQNHAVLVETHDFKKELVG